MCTKFMLLGVALLVAVGAWAQPVLDYVNAPDDSYAWEFEREETIGQTTVTHLTVTSQTWRGITWTHRVQLISPEGMSYPETALMLITGGSPNAQELMLLGAATVGVSAPVVVLGDIPNQPLFDNLREDALIAYTFAQFLESGEADWPLLFPMTKAAVRAMDAIEEYTAQNWERPVTSFITTGASKRGWTTWFTGAVAPERLKGIVPMVYDNLDLPAQMRHQVETWGTYSEMIHDYTERGLPDLLATAEGRRLGAIVDPYSLHTRITMPKLIITGTNDPYWPLDAANLYWDGLIGPKYILYVPNGGHGLGDFVRVLNAQIGFFLACTGRAPLPQPIWQFAEGRYLKLTVDPGPAVVRVTQWRAHSDTRDFRAARWEEQPALEHGGLYVARQLYPESGYSALFAEMVYDLNGREFPISTNVRIVGPR